MSKSNACERLIAGRLAAPAAAESGMRCGAMLAARQLALLLAAFHLPIAVQGVIVLPQIFSDGMVLQTNRAYGGRPFMYGSAAPGETVTIAGLDRRSAPGVPYPTLADAHGRWRLQLDPYQGPAAFNATISGSRSKNTITIRRIVYGDVILCSGQSNMNKPLSYVFNASAEIRAATHKNVRLFSVPETRAPNCGSGVANGQNCGPQTYWTARQCAGNPRTAGRKCTWQVLSPDTVKDFSAVCYLTVTEMMRIQPKLAASTTFGLVQAAVGEVAQDITLNFSDVWQIGNAAMTVRDLWQEKDLGSFTHQFTAKNVPSHGNFALRLSKGK